MIERRLFRWLWQTSEGLRLQAVLNASIGTAQVLLDFAFIYCTKWTVELATGTQTGSLRLAALTLTVIIISRLLLNFSSRWVSAILGVRSQNKIQLRLFSHLMRSEWTGLEHRHSGDVINRLERDVQDITATLTETIPSAIAVCVRLAGAFLFLYTMDHLLPFLLICISPVFALLSKLYIRRMRSITREVRATDSRIQSILAESLQHRMVLKTLERCQTMVARLSETQQLLRHHIRRRTVFSSTSATLLSAGFSLGYLVTFLWGVTRMHDGTITYGTMLAFIQLVGQIQSPFRDMSRFIPIIVGSLTATERLMELEDTPLEQEGSPILFPHGAGIRISHVDYTYPNGHRQVLRDLCFDFPPGSVTAVLGETGAGKTTLVRLILALLRPTNGHVTLYNEQQETDASPLTRANFVYVPQGNTLLSGTIRDNLLLGNPSATEEEMKEALDIACAHFVVERPGGLDARCGEMGSGLSEGQSQRIAIARALLRKGTVLLLDEATSSLDPETEQQLLENLATRQRQQQQTIICITHRPAVANYCTQSLLLQRKNQ